MAKQSQARSRTGCCPELDQARHEAPRELGGIRVSSDRKRKEPRPDTLSPEPVRIGTTNIGERGSGVLRLRRIAVIMRAQSRKVMRDAVAAQACGGSTGC